MWRIPARNRPISISRYKRLNFSTKFSIFFGEVNTNVISDSEPIDWIAGILKKIFRNLNFCTEGIYSTRRESSPCPKTAAYVMISVSTSVQWELTRGGTHPARAPPKIGINNKKWRKIVIFHTKYPKKFRAYLRSAQFFKCAPL